MSDMPATSHDLPDLSACPAQTRPALQALLARRSAWPLAEPGPGPEALGLAIDVALRAPDHGHLRPWRFVVIRGAARERLAEVLVDAARARDPHGDAQRFRAKVLAAPVIIALAAHVVRDIPKVPPVEQLLATGAAAMNLLNALDLLGYAGFWSTGANARDPRVKTALGFGSDDEFLGFIYTGTPVHPDERPERPARADFVREWSGPLK